MANVTAQVSAGILGVVALLWGASGMAGERAVVTPDRRRPRRRASDVAAAATSGALDARRRCAARATASPRGGEPGAGLPRRPRPWPGSSGSSSRPPRRCVRLRPRRAPLHAVALFDMGRAHEAQLAEARRPRRSVRRSPASTRATRAWSPPRRAASTTSIRCSPSASRTRRRTPRRARSPTAARPARSASPSPRASSPSSAVHLCKRKTVSASAPGPRAARERHSGPSPVGIGGATDRGRGDAHPDGTRRRGRRRAAPRDTYASPPTPLT